MFGLNADPATDHHYTSLDYAWYLAGRTLYIYENGSQIGAYGSYSTTDTLAIAYDGGTVRYLVNGAEVVCLIGQQKLTEAVRKTAALFLASVKGAESN